MLERIIDVFEILPDTVLDFMIGKLDKIIQDQFVVNIIKKHKFPKAHLELSKCVQYNNNLLPVIRRVLFRRYRKELETFNNLLLLM